MWRYTINLTEEALKPGSRPWISPGSVLKVLTKGYCLNESSLTGKVPKGHSMSGIICAQPRYDFFPVRVQSGLGHGTCDLGSPWSCGRDRTTRSTSALKRPFCRMSESRKK